MNAVWITIGAVILLLVLSAFFSGAETALTAASRSRLHQLARLGNHRATRVLRLLQHRDRLIGALLLGNNLVNILASALATSLMLTLFGDAGVVYATLAMTMLVLIFAEVLPKTYAIRTADQMALAVAPLVSFLVAMLAPVTRLIQWIVRLTLRPFGIDLHKESDPGRHEEELRGAIELHDGEAPETAHERQMLRSILDLDDDEVSEVMTHRRHVAMIDLNQPVEKLVEQVLASPYTRLPLYRDDQDDIVGVLHAKALLRAIHAKKGDFSALDIADIMVKPWFIPDTTSLLDQLQAFRQRREHFALVIDEYGSLMGVVTLEDILEQIVGNIDDETDIITPGVRPQQGGSYLVNGSVPIRALQRDLDWKLPDDNATTIAGLVLHEARRIPDAGQTFVFFGFRFEILRRQRNQIQLMRITPPDMIQQHP